MNPAMPSPRLQSSRLHVGQRGFSLLEILVTTVVFSIGALGIAGLSAVSKRAAFESVQRATAAELAYALLEQMRASDGALDVYLAAGPIGRGSLGAEPVPACDTVADICTEVQLARHSLWQWERMLDTGMETVGGAATGGLVDPTACIVGPGGAGDYVVTIVWRGLAELTDAGANPCGAGTGLYGAGNTFRRLVVIQSFIDPGV